MAGPLRINFLPTLPTNSKEKQMRYTTIIDISEIPSLYKNKNAVIVYLHLCLRAGYQDENRDIVETSIRRLASDLNMTVSTIRNALKRLHDYNLVTFENRQIKVKKWFLQETPTPRPKTAKQAKQQDQQAIRKHYEEERRRQINKEDAEREQEIRRQQLLLRRGKTVYMEVYEQYQEAAELGDALAIEMVKKHKERYENEKKYAENLLKAAKRGDKDALKKMGLQKWTVN